MRILCSFLPLVAITTISLVESWTVPSSTSDYVVQKATTTTLKFHRQQPRRRINFALKMSETAKKQEQTMSIESVSEKLLEVKDGFDRKMSAATTLGEAEAIRREYLGKKGPLNEAMSYMRLLSNEDKPRLGVVINEIKETLESVVAQRLEELERVEIELKMGQETIDVTLPGTKRMADIGRRHPLSMTMEKAVDIFTKLGYDTVTSSEDSPEIELDYYCFEALNCPKDHPARDMQDTFYLTDDMNYMLRTHTSSVQIRQLEKRKPPLRIVAPGRVYRKDDIDATHSLMFHQVEILAIEKRGVLNLGHLKGTVEHFLKNMLGPEIEIRFRGSYFPFTEPSMEVDVFFRGRWLEVLGCGMVDPNVLTMAGIDPEEYTGFAAGFGIERFAMVIHQITDIREFYKNDKRFLQQFPHFYDDGQVAFLNGMSQEVVVDYRGPEVPDPPVDSLEELIERSKTHDKAADSKTESGKETQPKETIVEPQSTADEIDISKLDIRVGVIKKVWNHPESDKLFCEEIDVGEETPRQIASGLRAHYTIDTMIDQRVLVICNLKARKLAGFESYGMILCASTDSTVQLLHPPDDAQIGDRIIIHGNEDRLPATENQIIKKKMLDVIFPKLQTNEDGIPTYDNVPLISLSTKSLCLPTTLPNAMIS